MLHRGALRQDLLDLLGGRLLQFAIEIRDQV